MAKKVIFSVTSDGVLKRTVDLKLPTGFAKSQKQKGIVLVHECFQRNFKGNKPLEISTKSEGVLGESLSAFNLKDLEGHTVEQLFQASKVFEDGGPYTDLLDLPSSKAKKDERLHNSGKLISFRYKDVDYPLEPKTAFYNYLYINTLLTNEDLVKQLLESNYTDFTDIEFNPDKSLNCQAEAIALFMYKKSTNKDDYSFEEVSKLCKESIK